MPNPEPLLGRVELEGVSYRTPEGKVILSGVSLRVEPGERLAIVGRNGAGKTTLLRLLFGRLRPTAGRVLVDGVDLGAIPPAERARRIAVVGQSDQPDGRLTVRDYVGLGRIPHRGHASARRDPAIVGQALARVGLSAFGARRLDHLSGGERQRAAMARALAQEPAILVLDEPTNHLDPRARNDILALAQGLGVTVIAALHDLALVGPFADRVAVVRDGRIVVHGLPGEALSRSVVRDVFDMDCFPVTNPQTGRALIVFDASAA